VLVLVASKYLHRDVAVIAEVETIQRFVAITVLLGIVLDQSAQAGRDTQPRLQRSIIDLPFNRNVSKLVDHSTDSETS